MSEDGYLIPSIGISASGLEAESLRMQVVANNIANADTTAPDAGSVFRRKEVIFAEKMDRALGNHRPEDSLRGVEIKGVVSDSRDPIRVYKPGHPHADSDGYVYKANISAVEEMVNMMSATRAYEANLAAVKAAKRMASQALQLGK
jgi:flagellar basal-body rod protein FlgC